MSTPSVASGNELDLNTPFLGDRAPSLRGASRVLSRATSQRVLREPSIRVREATSEGIEELAASSKPLLLSALIIYLIFVFASLSVLVLSREEKAPPLLRWWVVAITLQCLLHTVSISMIYRNRRRRRASAEGGGEENPGGFDFEKLKDWNGMAGVILCIIGLYWVFAISPDDAPHLYWMCAVISVTGIFIPVFILAVACVIGIAICCCLPCIIGILHLVANEEGAKKEDIEKLPKFIFRSQDGMMRECDTNSPVERVIPVEDAECSICLNAYDDGAELRELPCRHHFHTACVDKWLHIKATCPLCKLNIGNHNDGDQV